MPSMVGPGAASRSPSVSGNGSTAPVLEFICLFTHDLRRKQKRWEDGRLRFHTFNKRVMVYDERGHFIGDTHWRRDWVFDEGEEIQLDRGGVIVQVSECVGHHEQDLSELLDKRAKEKEQRQSRVIRPGLYPSPAAPVTPRPGTGPSEHFQTRHRPLNQLLGTPSGHHGRAVVPSESPFELRQRNAETPGDRAERPSKRRRCDDTPPRKLGFAQALFGATLTLSAVPISSAPPRRPVASTYRGQETLPQDEAIRLPDAEHSDEATSGAASSMASCASGSARVPMRPDQAAVSGGPRPLDTSRAPSGVRLGKATASLLKSVKRSKDNSRHIPLPAGTTAPTVAANQGKVSTRSEAMAGQTAYSAGRIRVTDPAEEVDTNPNVAPGLGASRSQAIVLDEDQDQRADGRHSFGRQTSGPTGPNRGLSRPKEKPPNRNRLSELPVPPQTTTSRPVPAADNGEEPPLEERTELRLKPRQKRGLLLMSEKKNRPRQTRREVPAKQAEHDGRSPVELATDEAAELMFDDGAQSVRAPSVAEEIDSFGFSHAVPQHAGEVEGMPTSSPSPDAAIDPNDVDDEAEGALGLPESPEPPPDTTNEPNDEAANLSSSPPVRRVRATRRVSAKVHTELSGTSSPEPEEPFADAAAEPAPLGSPRHARERKNQSDRRSSRLKKKPRKAESEESGDELPQRPVRPHLTRLSKKSVRSREVIGFVPSSPPVVNYTSLLHPRLGVGSAGHDEPVATRTPQREGTTPPGPAEGTVPSGDDSAIPALAGVVSRHSSLSNGDDSGPAEDSREQRSAHSPSPHAPERHNPKRRMLSATPPRRDTDSNPATTATVPGPQSLAASEEDTTRSAAKPTNVNQTTAPAAANMTLRSALHDDPINLPRRLNHPIKETRDNGYGTGVTERANHSTAAAAPAVAAAPVVCAAPAVDARLAPAPAQPAAPPRPRIANPATRGRKAALKSDAAGQVPVPILPADPVGPPHAAPPVPRPGPAAAGPGGAAERPRRTMKFPGFASARGGGPWSREAHDLLESARPG